ncbi:hypothetical protein LV779_17035 [Streptomyces thinghirensis]|nr:hypothetical protein [Streptomyces thinghirensis]
MIAERTAHRVGRPSGLVAAGHRLCTRTGALLGHADSDRQRGRRMGRSVAGPARRLPGDGALVPRARTAPGDCRTAWVWPSASRTPTVRTARWTCCSRPAAQAGSAAICLCCGPMP